LKSYTFVVTGSPPPSGVNTSRSFLGQCQEVRRTVLIAECVASRQGIGNGGLDKGEKEAGVLTVPLGERHISFNLNSFTRSSSGVMVAYSMPTLYLRTAAQLLDH